MSGAGARTLYAVALAGSMLSCRLSSAEYESIAAWLLCDECINNERAGVRAIGGAAVHTLDRALVGPSPGRIANKVAQFRRTYRSLPAPTVAESTYVEELRSNYIAKYQARAAISLGDIGGSRALAALRRARDSAAARAYRADVVNIVDAVVALASNPRYTGMVTPPAPRFGDTVRITRGSGQSWTRDERVTLHGSVFAESLVARRWAQDSLALLAVAPMGEHAVTVAWRGAPAGQQTSPLRIVPPGYASHTAATAPLVTASPFPQTRYLLLPGRANDSTDFFRFQPAATTTVTARLATSGTTPATLRWYECAGFSLIAPPGPLTGVIGYVVDERGSPVENVQVTRLGIAGSTTTGSNGRFVLSPIPSASPVTLRAAKIDFRPSVTLVQLAADSIQLGIIRTGVSEAVALSRHASTLTIPAGACRLLEVRVPSRGGPRTLRLQLTSP